jgi:hypothetical protein
LLAGDLTTFTSLLAEVAPIEDGGQTSLEDQQVNLSTCLLASDLTTFSWLLVGVLENGGQTNQQVYLSICLLIRGQ